MSEQNVGGAALAAHLSMSRQNHHRYIRAGVLPARGENGFPLDESRTRYIEHLRKSAAAWGRAQGPLAHSRRDNR